MFHLRWYLESQVEMLCRNLMVWYKAGPQIGIRARRVNPGENRVSEALSLLGSPRGRLWIEKRRDV